MAEEVLRVYAMRAAAAVVMLVCTGRAQFKSAVPLVVAPTTVTDAKGRFVDGLTPDDLILYDNSVPQPVQTDWMAYPISANWPGCGGRTFRICSQK